MTVWNKLVTALRGAAHEAGEAVTDSHALRILDQEIRDADSDLNKSKEALAEIMAKQKLAVSKLQITHQKISEYEGYALKALETNDEALALEVASKVAVLESQRDEEESQSAAYTQSVEELRTAITLREVEGLSYEEIAAKMQCPIGTVRSRIFRAREAIDTELRPLVDTESATRERART